MFIINDRLYIALLVDADGVHVGQSDISAKEVRKLIGPNKIVGVYARTLDEAIEAKADGADYLGGGAMFGINTKLDAKYVTIDTLKHIKEIIDLPIVVIGRLNLENMEELKEFNIEGYAIVSAILGSKEIYLETQKWKDKI